MENVSSIKYDDGDYFSMILRIAISKTMTDRNLKNK